MLVIHLFEPCLGGSECRAAVPARDDNAATVAPAADDLIAGLDPGHSRLLVAVSNGRLAGWLSIRREANPLITHWGTVSRLQTDPAFRGLGIGSALMIAAH